MAGTEEEKDIQTGPENTENGSLADDFSEGPGIQLTGHPAMSEEEPTSAEDDKEEKLSSEAGKTSETPSGKKYKTHEEAEAGAREHQRFATEKAEEAKREKEAREAAERERDELKQKLEVASKPPEKEPDKPASDDELNAQVEAVAEAANEEALATIGELDRTDPDYPKLVAKAWAKANAKVVKAAARAPLSQADIDALIDKRLQTKDAETAAQREEQRKKDEASEGARLEAKAKELGTKAGLDLDDPESADSIIWDRMKGQIPDEVYAKGTLEAQAEWVTAEVRKRTGKVAQTAAEREEAARRTQNENGVLGRGGHKPSKPFSKEGDLGSLGSDFAEVRQQRAIL